MTQEGKIAKSAIEKAEGRSIEEQNKIFIDALREIVAERKKKTSTPSSWDVTPCNRECSYGYVNNNGWV